MLQLLGFDFMYLMLVIGISVLTFVLLFFLSGIRIIPKWEKVVVLRLGKFREIKGPGLIWIAPIFDKIIKVSLKDYTHAFSGEKIFIKDNIPATIDFVLYYKVVDAKKAILNVKDFEQATRQIALESLRETLSKMSLNEILSDKEKIEAQLQKIIDSKIEEWGIKATNAKIFDVSVLQ